MTSKKMYKKWLTYMMDTKIPKSKKENAGDTILLYGTDEFKIDKNKKRIKLKGLGDWIGLDDIDVNLKIKEIKWVAIESKNSEYNLIVGNYDAFVNSEENPLWRCGELLAIPFQNNMYKNEENILV